MLKKLTALSLAAMMLPLGGAHAQDLSTMSWDDIVAQAKQEGQVTWFHWYLQDRFREVVKGFEAEYGITVTIPDGEAAANFNKFLAEKDRPEGDIDVLSVTGANIPKFKGADYSFGPLRDILPDADKLRFEIDGASSDGYAVAFWGNQTGIAYDPKRINEADLPQTVADFEAFFAANPQQFGFNAENGGAGPSFVEAIMQNLVPDLPEYTSGVSSPEALAKVAPVWEWFNAHEAEFVITASNADSVTRLNAGEFLLVPAYEDLIAGLQTTGEISRDIKIYVPEMGMQGAGNVVTIPANAQHKAAALVFVNWLTSAETQTGLNQFFGSAPQHPDANSDAALLSPEQRALSTMRIVRPFGDDIRAQFLEQVTLN